MCQCRNRGRCGDRARASTGRVDSGGANSGRRPAFTSYGETILNVRRRPDYRLSRRRDALRTAPRQSRIFPPERLEERQVRVRRDLGTGAQSAVLVENGVVTVLATNRHVHSGNRKPPPRSFWALPSTATEMCGLYRPPCGMVSAFRCDLLGKKGNRLVDQTYNCKTIR